MINRQEAARALVGALSDQLVVTGLGNVANDVFAAGDRAQNFYARGSMGMAASIALGLARARPDDRVVCVDGEGSLLMNHGALATIGRYAPRNLACVVWDNEAYQITGGQSTHTAAGVDLAAVARGCGIASASTAATVDELTTALGRILDAPGPHLLVAKVDRTLATGWSPRRPALIKYRFMGKIGTLEDVRRLVWE